MDNEYRKANVKDIEQKFNQPEGSWQAALARMADKMGLNGPGMTSGAQANPSPTPSADPMVEAIKRRQMGY